MIVELNPTSSGKYENQSISTLNDLSMEGQSKQIKEELIQSSTEKIAFITFDDVLNDMGFGLYQIITYSIMASLALAEGAQIMVFTIMIPILENEWGVKDWQNGLQASLIFVSFLIGSVVSGQIADRLGRKRPIIVSSGCMFIISFCSALAPNIGVLITLRAFLGLLVGFFAPLGATMLAELTPLAKRGRYMALIQLSLSLGLIFGICMALVILPDLNHGNWRALIVVCTLPAILAFVLSIIFLDESPRYEIVLGKYDEAFIIIEKINKINGRRKFKTLSEESKKSIISWSKELNKTYSKEDVASVRALFKEHGKIVTPILWIDWFTTSFVYYGIVIFLPDTLEKIKNEQKGSESQDIVKLLISTVTEIFAVLLAAVLIELKHFGRKNSMIIFYLLTAFISLIVYLDESSHFIIWATIAKFFITMTAVFCFQFTSEVYSTKCRTTGLGMASGLGRFGGIMMPWVCVSLSDINPVAPFLAFVVLSMIAGIINFLIPFDTTGKPLDSIDEQETEIKENDSESG